MENNQKDVMQKREAFDAQYHKALENMLEEWLSVEDEEDYG